MFSEMSYHVWKFLGFKANDQWYGHIHGIVGSNDIILCTRVHLGMAKKNSKGGFHFLCTKKSFSIFWVPKINFFVKNIPNLCCKIAAHHFSKILDHILCTIDQMVPAQKLSFLRSSNSQNSADSEGTGSSLN